MHGERNDVVITDSQSFIARAKTTGKTLLMAMKRMLKQNYH